MKSQRRLQHFLMGQEPKHKKQQYKVPYYNQCVTMLRQYPQHIYYDAKGRLYFPLIPELFPELAETFEQERAMPWVVFLSIKANNDTLEPLTFPYEEEQILLTKYTDQSKAILNGNVVAEKGRAVALIVPV